MTPYVSIDIETTGLNPMECQILEVGAVIDDGRALENLPQFHCYVLHQQIVGSAFALSMHPTILRRIANPGRGPSLPAPRRSGQAIQGVVGVLRLSRHR